MAVCTLAGECEQVRQLQQQLDQLSMLCRGATTSAAQAAQHAEQLQQQVSMWCSVCCTSNRTLCLRTTCAVNFQQWEASNKLQEAPWAGNDCRILCHQIRLDLSRAWPSGQHMGTACCTHLEGQHVWHSHTGLAC